MSRMSFCIDGLSLPLPTISKDCTSGIPAASMVASWRLNTAMSSGLTLPPALNACDCFLILLTAMPWRRSSERNAPSSGARLLPLTRLPFLSMPDQLKGVSRLAVLAPAVATAVAMVRLSLLDGDAVDFLEASHALPDLLEAGAAEVPHAFLFCVIADVDGVAAFHDHASHGLGDRHHLVDTDAPFVSISAAGAALGGVNLDAGAHVGFLESFLEQRLGGDLDQGFALRAQATRQALRDDEAHRRGDGVRLDAHVDQTRQRLRRVVGVQRGHHEVTGLRGLDGDLRG